MVLVPFTRKPLRSSDVKRPETDIQAEDGRNLPEGFKPNGFGIHNFLYKGAYTYVQIFSYSLLRISKFNDNVTRTRGRRCLQGHLLHQVGDRRASLFWV